MSVASRASSSRSMAASTINVVLHPLGYRIGRIDPRPASLPVLDMRAEVDDPIEAIYRANSIAVLVNIPTARIRSMHILGFRCAGDAGHPLIEAVTACLRHPAQIGSESPLRAFYERWRPANAAEVLGLGRSSSAATLMKAPPHCYPALPWSSSSVEELALKMPQWIKEENSRHGTALDAGHGHTFFGPLSESKWNMEFVRIKSISLAVSSRGFERSNGADGDILGFVMIRGGEWVLNAVEGQHRLAALAALGWSEIPIRIPYRRWSHPNLVYRSDVASWPNVRNGLFSERDALDVFDRIFDGRQPSGCMT
jgi:hypothetical protein